MANLIQSSLEIWKDIPGYEKFYQASTLGNLRSLDRYIWRKNNTKYGNTFYKGKLLKPFKQKDGYLLISLSQKDCRLVHRVIYETFVGKIPEGWYAIMHKNNIKNDNRLCNLQLGTYSENAIQAVRDKLYVHGRTGKHGANNPQSKAVKQMNTNGDVIRIFESMNDAAKELKISQRGISGACLGYKKSCGGYKWEIV